MYSREVLPTDSTIKGVGFWGKSYRSFRVKSEGLQVVSLGQTTQKNPAYAGICLFMKLKKKLFWGCVCCYWSYPFDGEVGLREMLN